VKGAAPRRRIRVSGVNIVADQEYVNPFEDVHKKAKAFRDRALEANKSDAEFRESRLVREAKELLDRETR
jgi:hypothetical protein